VIIENDIYTLTFDLINPQTSQPSPEVRVLAEIKHAGTIVSNVEQSPMAKQDLSLSGIANGTHPLKVVIVPRFLTSTIGQSNPVSGAINTLTATLLASMTFGSGSTVTISGLTGSQTADTATLAVNSTSNCFRAEGVWTKMSGQLVLTASGIVSAGKPVVVAFSLINPATRQRSPRVMVEAEMKDETAVADEGGPGLLLGNGLVAIR
jgi:hypothetical protein